MPFIESRTEYTFWSLWSAPLIVATGTMLLVSMLWLVQQACINLRVMFG